jgi:hypothetical protein
VEGVRPLLLFLFVGSEDLLLLLLLLPCEVKLMGSHAIALAHAVIGVVALLAEGMPWGRAAPPQRSRKERRRPA